MADNRRNHDEDAVERQALLIDMVPVQMWFLADAVTYGSVNQDAGHTRGAGGAAAPVVEWRRS
jgi:hypothetical protein